MKIVGFEELFAALHTPGLERVPDGEGDFKIGDLVEVVDVDEEVIIGILIDRFKTYVGDGETIQLLKLKTPEGDIVVTSKGDGFGRSVRKLG
jgi:hypothetical protein